MKRLVIATMFAAFMAVAAQAEAVGITGSISFGGAAQPLGGTNWGNATGVDFGASTTIQVASSPAPSGAYAGTQGLDVTFTDFTFAPFPGGGVVPLWTFTSGLTTYSFNLTTLNSFTPSGGQAGSTLTINGSGILRVTGLDDTVGTFLFTAQGFDNVGGPLATFSFSASDIAVNVVPEPGSMVLLGTGLLGLAAVARRRMRKA